MKLKKIDIFLIVFLAVLIFLTVLFIFRSELGTAFSFSAWTGRSGGVTFDFWSGTFAAVVASFLGALVPFPVPYVLVISVVAYQFSKDAVLGTELVIWIIIVAAFSNVIGDMFDWVIGRIASYFRDRSEKENTSESGTTEEDVSETGNMPQSGRGAEEISEPSYDRRGRGGRWERLILGKPRLIPFIIILFGATPLPESLLFTPLGLVKYSPKKTMVFSVIGKIIMMTVSALAGVYGIDPLLDIMGGTGGSWITGMALLYLSWLIIFLMTKFD